MILKPQFVILAATIFGDRVYPAGDAQPGTTAYCTYSAISEVEESDLDANGGADNLCNTRLQIDVWAERYSEAQTKAKDLRDALKLWNVVNVFQSAEDMYETETKLHRVMLDISFWHSYN